MPGVTTLTVTRAEDGQKLLQYLERRLQGVVPRSAIQKWIRTGQVRVDSGRKKPFDRIHEGQQVRIPPYDDANSTAHNFDGNAFDKQQRTISRSLSIVHEDDDLLVIAKPAGLPAHGGTGHTDSVAARLALRSAGSDFAPTLAHRLDRDTSGLLLVAKTYNKLRELNELMASGGLNKTYLAWVRGTWPHMQEVLLEDRLEKQGAPGNERMAAGSGKIALARVRMLTTRLGQDGGKESVSLLAVTLLTGRTHQIRVQLAERGHPILGDTKYGPSKQKECLYPAGSTMLLHAFQLRLPGLELRLPPPWKGPFAVEEHILHTFPSDSDPRNTTGE